jgi:hypothetical protein
VEKNKLKFDLTTKINLLPILDWQKQKLLGMLEQSTEQVKQIIHQIQDEKKTFDDAMVFVEAAQQLPETYKQDPAFSENAPCKGIIDTEDYNNFCSKFKEQESCIEPKPYSRGGTPLGNKQKCKWTPSGN